MRISDWSSDVCSSDLFKPGADVALLNGMLHVIMAEGLYDRQYVEAQTEGFAALKAHLADYATEKMDEICGIPAATIREVARLYAKAERAIIFWGQGESGGESCEGRVGQSESGLAAAGDLKKNYKVHTQ